MNEDLENAKFNGKSLTEFTDRELLKLLAEKTEKLNQLRLDEQEFIDSHDGRDFWDDETEEEYQELVDDVLAVWHDTDAICEFVGNLR